MARKAALATPIDPTGAATTLNPVQELLAVELQRTLLLPVDDLPAVIRKFIDADVSRSGLDGCLRRHGVSDLEALQPLIEDHGMPRPTRAAPTSCAASSGLRR